MRIILLACAICSTIANVLNTISADCDAEFAEAASKLAADHVADPAIVKYMHAVLASCNKAPIQKMAEISVFLLKKGTITPQVMGEIKALHERLQKRKDAEMSQKIGELPPELYSTAQKIRKIMTSGGLSGNERRQEIEDAVHSLPASYRHRVYRLFEQTIPKLDGSKVEENGNQPIELSTPPASFAIQKQVEIEPPVRNEDQGEGLGVPAPPPPPPPQQNILFPELPPPIKAVSQGRSIPANLQGLLSNPNFDKLLSSIVQKGAKIANGPLPESVGAVNHHAENGPFALLNPSMWSDAARFLSRTSNDLPSALSQFMEQNSMPQVFAPIRRQNDGALDSYDTHVDRFATSGPTNAVKVPGDLSAIRAASIGGDRPAPIQPNQVDSIVGAMPTISPGYATYAPAPAIVPKISGPITPDEITGSYRRRLNPPVRIDVVNEQ